MVVPHAVKDRDRTDRVQLPTGELPVLEDPVVEPRRRHRLTLKLLLFSAVAYYFIVPLIPDFRDAWSELSDVEPVLLAVGLTLELVALWCYAPLMKAALGDAGDHLSLGRLFRVQMSTRALSSIVPGGSAASSALGYRLMTLSGIGGADAGFALATVGLGSAVVLNLILWTALIVSIPVRGVNPIYGSVALVGVIVMLLAAALVFGLMDGQGRSERAIRWLARAPALQRGPGVGGAGAPGGAARAADLRSPAAGQGRFLGGDELALRRRRALDLPAAPSTSRWTSTRS